LTYPERLNTLIKFDLTLFGFRFESRSEKEGDICDVIRGPLGTSRKEYLHVFNFSLPAGFVIGRFVLVKMI